MDIYAKLTELLKDYKNIIIMTHKNPDLDGLASAICLNKILKSMDKNVCVYKSYNVTNESVLKMFKKLEKSKESIKYINETNYMEEITDSPLLIILDVNKEYLLDNPNLLKSIKDIIVIDHHLKSKDHIENTIYSYVDSSLSSIAEFMANYVKYLNIKISPLLATILLAAIEVDTNSFNIKTKEETHMTAAFLMSMGADNIEKQEILKENRNDYLKRQDLLKNSFMIDNVALCIFDENIYKKEELAITATELLQFEGVEASYVIGKTGNNKVSISARSIGKIDVEKTMKALGGGGHLTEAAAEINTSDINEVKKLIIDEVIK